MKKAIVAISLLLTTLTLTSTRMTAHADQPSKCNLVACTIGGVTCDCCLMDGHSAFYCFEKCGRVWCD